MARALARRGHEVTVACYAHGVGAPDPEYRVVRTPAVPGYDNLRAGPDLVKPALDLALAWKLARLRADVVHAHNYGAPIAAALARLRTGTPLVYNAHNTMGEAPHLLRGAGQSGGRPSGGSAAGSHRARLAEHALAISRGQTLEDLGCPVVSHVSPGIDLSSRRWRPRRSRRARGWSTRIRMDTGPGCPDRGHAPCARGGLAAGVGQPRSLGSAAPGCCSSRPPASPRCAGTWPRRRSLRCPGPCAPATPSSS